MTNANQKPPRFVAYWLGYRSPAPSLEAIPDCVDAVVLAFALVRPGNVIDPSFMFNPPNSAVSIAAGVKGLQARGKKVLLCVGGWAGNCWANVTDVASLAASIMALVDQWGLDGVDIDYESDHELHDWMKVPCCPTVPYNDPTPMLDSLVQVLRASLGPSRYLTAVTAYGDPYITVSLDQLNWVATMDYGGTGAYDTMAAAYMQRHAAATSVPFVLGVCCSGDQQQTLAQVQALCGHKPPVGTLSMMLWDLSEDNPDYSHDPLWAYTNTINKYLPPG